LTAEADVRMGLYLLRVLANPLVVHDRQTARAISPSVLQPGLQEVGQPRREFLVVGYLR